LDIFAKIILKPLWATKCNDPRSQFSFKIDQYRASIVATGHAIASWIEMETLSNVNSQKCKLSEMETLSQKV
jgi:hypothetical protein